MMILIFFFLLLDFLYSLGSQDNTLSDFYFRHVCQ